MVRQEVGHSASSRTIERIYARVSRRRERLDPFGFRVEEFEHRPHVRAALDRMAAADAEEREQVAAARPDAAADHAEVARVVREFVAATCGLSSRAVQAETGVAYRTVLRLRSGEQASAYGVTLERMRAYVDRGGRAVA
jgi:hypothetical protein